jgi:hypothetical protein
MPIDQELCLIIVSVMSSWLSGSAGARFSENADNESQRVSLG